LPSLALALMITQSSPSSCYPAHLQPPLATQLTADVSNLPVARVAPGSIECTASVWSCDSLHHHALAWILASPVCSARTARDLPVLWRMLEGSGRSQHALSTLPRQRASCSRLTAPRRQPLHCMGMPLVLTGMVWVGLRPASVRQAAAKKSPSASRARSRPRCPCSSIAASHPVAEHPGVLVGA
jgi:hypothetical protein